MHKNHVFKVLIAVFSIVMVSVTTINLNAILAVHADSTTYGNPVVPWEINHHGYDVQPLHHGNEIYYRIHLLHIDHFYNIWQYAINTWNQLGVVKLVPAPTTYHGEVINLTGTSKYRNHLAGGNISIAQTAFNVHYRLNYHRSLFTHCDIRLNKYLIHTSLNMQKEAATHELGHALGFDHDPNKIGTRPSVMNALYKPDYVIPGEYDRQALLAVYQPKSFDRNQFVNAAHQYLLPVMKPNGTVVNYQDFYSASNVNVMQHLQNQYDQAHNGSNSQTQNSNNNSQSSQNNTNQNNNNFNNLSPSQMVDEIFANLHK